MNGTIAVITPYCRESTDVLARRRTVAFRSRYQKHYRAAGQEPPANAKSDSDFESCKQYLSSVSGIHETVDKLGFWPWS